MEAGIKVPTAVQPAVFLKAGEDRYGHKRGLGINTIDFKVTKRESAGVFILEITMHKNGGPVRHVHHGQDEWWYVVKGEFAIEVGEERRVLGEGDSAWGPRGIPHVWASVSGPGARFVAALTPAGEAEGFFLEGAKANQVPGMDSPLFHKYGFEVVGPPLPVD